MSKCSSSYKKLDTGWIYLSQVHNPRGLSSLIRSQGLNWSKSHHKPGADAPQMHPLGTVLLFCCPVLHYSEGTAFWYGGHLKSTISLSRSLLSWCWTPNTFVGDNEQKNSSDRLIWVALFQAICSPTNNSRLWELQVCINLTARGTLGSHPSNNSELLMWPENEESGFLWPFSKVK